MTSSTTVLKAIAEVVGINQDKMLKFEFLTTLSAFHLIVILCSIYLAKTDSVLVDHIKEQGFINSDESKGGPFVNPFKIRGRREENGADNKGNEEEGNPDDKQKVTTLSSSSNVKEGTDDGSTEEETGEEGKETETSKPSESKKEKEEKRSFWDKHKILIITLSVLCSLLICCCCGWIISCLLCPICCVTKLAAKGVGGSKESI